MRTFLSICLVAMLASAANAEEAGLVDDLRLVARLKSEGRHDMALTLASRLVAVNPDSLRANLTYQDLRLARGQKRELIREYSRAAAKSEATADQVFLYARLLDGRRAISGLKRALKIDPKHFPAMCALGARLIGSGDGEEAEEILVRARRVRATSAVPVNLLGRLAESRGDAKHAESRYREAADIDPTDPLPRLNLAVLLVGQRRYPEARTLLAAVRKLDPADPMPLLVAGMVMAAEGDFEAALTQYREALELKTNTVASLNMLGSAYMGLEQFDLARKAFAKALVEEPKRVATVLNLCYLCLRENDVAKATAWAKKARKIDSRSAQACYFAGLCEEFSGKQKAAERSYKRAVDLDPENPGFHRALGTYYSNRTRYRDAVRAYERAAELTDRSPAALTDLAFAHVGAGSPKKALACFEEVVAKEADNLTAWMNIGLLCQEKLSDPEKAAHAYEEYLRRGGKDERVKEWLGKLKRR
jgi:Flp pilus assembly protein TadD